MMVEKLILKYIGTDSWNRPVFKDQYGNIFKDTNLGDPPLALCTVSGGFEGEPDTPIYFIDKYKEIEIEIVGMENQFTKEERLNYQLLDRLKTDCEYYLGYGNRNKKYLYQNSVEAHINEMKRIYNSFDEDKKPEWLSWNDILNYERNMN